MRGPELAGEERNAERAADLIASSYSESAKYLQEAHEVPVEPPFEPQELTLRTTWWEDPNIRGSGVPSPSGLSRRVARLLLEPDERFSRIRLSDGAPPPGMRRRPKMKALKVEYSHGA